MKDNSNYYETLKEKRVSLAQERDARVILAKTKDTHRVLDIVKSADRGIRLIRANLLIRYSPQEVLSLLEEYQEAVQKLHEATQKICSFTGVTYRPPKGLVITAVEGDGKKARKDKLLDARMDMAYQNSP